MNGRHPSISRRAVGVAILALSTMAGCDTYGRRRSRKWPSTWRGPLRLGQLILGLFASWRI